MVQYANRNLSLIITEFKLMNKTKVIDIHTMRASRKYSILQFIMLNFPLPFLQLRCNGMVMVYKMVCVKGWLVVLSLSVFVVVEIELKGSYTC